jgi:hypothetical protein
MDETTQSWACQHITKLNKKLVSHHRAQLQIEDSVLPALQVVPTDLLAGHLSLPWCYEYGACNAYAI